jgi:hypothetical protein
VTLSVPRNEVLVPARFLTPRDESRRTMGAAVGRVGLARGKPLLPWQRYVADVGGEVDERGRFVYSLCLVSVQRQAGKTELKEDQAVQRALQGPNRRCWDTAQTGQDARDKHRELADALAVSPLAPLIAKRRQAAGSEGLVFVNGSTLRPHPPTRDAMHGKQSDHNDVDEAWAHDEAHGADLMQAIIPTQATRPGAQTWVWSARGDRSSTWFHGLLEQGYAGLPGVALFDFGIPLDADPTDLDVIAAHHPAYGYPLPGGGGIDMAALRSAQSALSPGEFARAYGNVPTGAGERVIPVDVWERARTLEVLPAGRPAYGLAVAGDGSAAALLAAVLDRAGRPVVEVVEHRPGRSWLVERVLELRDAGQGIAVDRRGPAAPVADRLELAGVELLPLGLTDTTAACQDLFDRVSDPAGPRLLHRSADALDDSLDAAERRYVGDGGWVWKRNPYSAPLEAATLAAWAVARNPEPEPAPFVVFA